MKCTSNTLQQNVLFFWSTFKDFSPLSFRSQNNNFDLLWPSTSCVSLMHAPTRGSVTLLSLLRMKNLSCGEVTDLAQGHTAVKLQCWALKPEPVSVCSSSVPCQRCWVRCSENNAFTLRNTWLLSSGLGTVNGLRETPGHDWRSCLVFRRTPGGQAVWIMGEFIPDKRESSSLWGAGTPVGDNMEQLVWTPDLPLRCHFLRGLSL